MVRRPRILPTTSGAPKEPAGRRARPDIVHSSLYLPEPVYEALRESAFKERCKIHNIITHALSISPASIYRIIGKQKTGLAQLE